MRAGEFVSKIKKLAEAREVTFRFDPGPGKGSHGRLYYGDRWTTVKDRKEEVGTGLVGKMLKDLGLSKKDLGL